MSAWKLRRAAAFSAVSVFGLMLGFTASAHEPPSLSEGVLVEHADGPRDLVIELNSGIRGRRVVIDTTLLNDIAPSPPVDDDLPPFAGDDQQAAPSASTPGPCGVLHCPATTVDIGIPTAQPVYGEILSLFEPPARGTHGDVCTCVQCQLGVIPTSATVSDACRSAGQASTCGKCQNQGSSLALQSNVPEPTADVKLRRGEAAEVVLELIDNLGPSVLNGTLFENGTATCASEHHDTKATPQRAARELVAQWIRKLDADRPPPAHASDEHEVFVASPTKQHKVKLIKSVKSADPADPVDALRHVARTLDEAAELLEQQSLYPRADQLRGLAQQLRHEARGHHSQPAQPYTSPRPATTPPYAASPSPYRPPTPAPPRNQRDLEEELRRLRHDLEQTRHEVHRELERLHR